MTLYESVWDALKDTPTEAANMRLRSTTMMLVSQAVTSWGLSQRKAATKLGVTQPRLSELMTGKIDRFSLDALVSLASQAGIELDIGPRAPIKPIRKAHKVAREHEAVTA